MSLGSQELPLRVAIVGSGPAGFYAAAALLKAPIAAQIDIFDRLPVPYGLVRSGVAPDHSKIKSVTKIFERTAKEKAISFFGNVQIGEILSVAELLEFYDAIILSHGADTDRRLEIPGEDLPGSHTATEFVGWYNCHPDYRDRRFDLSAKKVVVIGQGNVAVDVVRVMAKPISELASTDISSAALDELAKSQIREIYMIGRRGPVQGAFTDKELRELGEIENCDISVLEQEVSLSAVDQQELEQADKGRKRNFEILCDFAKRSSGGRPRKIELRFFRSPVEILGSDRVTGIKLEINELSGPPGNQKARGTGRYETLPCDLVFRSVGYRGRGLPGLPFDAGGTYPNQAGRVFEHGSPLRGVYAAGWIKRGPSGVIGTNKADAAETVESLLADLPQLTPCRRRSTDELLGLLRTRGVRVLTFSDWEKLDAAELARGAAKNKEREKFVGLDEFLSALP